MPRQQNPMRQSWLGEGQSEGWIAHRLTLLVSPAWRHRPVPLIRVLERLEIEHLRHGGGENGRLHVSFDQFESFGISRRVIAPAIECGVHLGLIEVRQSHEMVSNLKARNLYRLAYVPEKGKRAPTDEWENVSKDDAKAAADRFKASQKKSGGQCPFPQTPSALSCIETASPSALLRTSPVPQRAHTIISGGKPGGDGLVKLANGGRSKPARHAENLQSNSDRDYSESGDLGSIPAGATTNPKPFDASTATELPDDARSLLKWMQGYDGMATHRTAQQHMSGVLKGDQITVAVDSLQSMDLITVEEVPNQKGTKSRIYQLTDAGRNPVLVGDRRQIDLEQWLAEVVN